MGTIDEKFETAKQRFERFLAQASDSELDEFRLNRNRMADQMNAMHTQVASRWSLSLGIGNGAGLTAVGTKIFGETVGPWTYLLMPSALLFGAGLCLVGLSHGLALWRIEHKAQVTEAQNIALDRADMNHWREENLKMTRPLWLVETAAEIGAAALFLIGVAYPLLVLWGRLFFKGTLLP